VNGDATIMQPKSIIQNKMKQLFGTGSILKASADEYVVGALFAAGCIGIVSERSVI